MKAIILAGGSGSRLYPLTTVVSKQLLPVYDKPMIYYPLTTVVNAGVEDICIITKSSDKQLFENLFGCGNDFGINIQYKVQDKPKGIADAFNVAADFINTDESVMLILGDNLFWGTDIEKLLHSAIILACDNKASIFGYKVADPRRYGVAEYIYDFGNYVNWVTSLEEKPKNPKSEYAVPGLYIYPNGKELIKFTKELEPSDRGELEITDINKIYMNDKRLAIHILEDGNVWLDMGTPESLYEAGAFVETIQKRTGKYIGCFEEVLFRNLNMSLVQMGARLSRLKGTAYAQYLINVLKEYDHEYKF